MTRPSASPIPSPLPSVTPVPSVTLSPTSTPLCLTITTTDSYGDGWDDAYWTLADAAATTTLGSGTLASGSSVTAQVCHGTVIKGACYTFTLNAGMYPFENSWAVADIDGAPLGSGSGVAVTVTGGADLPRPRPRPRPRRPMSEGTWPAEGANLGSAEGSKVCSQYNFHLNLNLNLISNLN